MGLRQRLLRSGRLREVVAFGLVGGVCLATDVVLFNVLAFAAGLLPELAKGLTMLVTGTLAFLGHRYVTFRHRQGRGVAHEVPLFAIVTGLSLAAGLGPIWLARAVMGLNGALWLNAANLVGIALGAGARYLAYRHVVWGTPRAPEGQRAETATMEAGLPG